MNICAYMDVDDHVEWLSEWNHVDVNKIEEDIFHFPVREFVILLRSLESSA